MFPVGLATSFHVVGGRLQPRFGHATKTVSARVQLPRRSTEPFQVVDIGSGMAAEVSLEDAREADGQEADGYLVYPAAHASGATILNRVLPDGLEDYLSFEERPRSPAISYRVQLKAGVGGLRLVAGILEMVDASGTPRLRVAAPYLVDANGARTDAALAVKGCAVDTNPAPPWGRRVTAPGAQTCTLSVSWSDAAVVYPAVLDPQWTTTGSMATARQEHTATLLATGKVLVVGGRSGSGTTALATAELFDRITGTWAATASLAGARRLHTATELNTSSNSTTSGKILIAGGINGTTSQNTAQLYSPTEGTWVAAGNLNAARHGHTATRLANGRVLVAGGMNGTTTLTSAAVYNPTSGAGSWAATTGPIPPPGLKAHTATLITTSNQQLNGKVLLVGGNSGSATIAAVYLFDPTPSAFSTLASLSGPREGHTATSLANGKILVTGGKNGSTTLATAVVFDPSSGPGSWSSAGTMTSPRQGHTATLLPAGIVANGLLLIAGGSSNGTNTLSSAELFSGTSTWTATTPMVGPVQRHTATALPNGAVLIAGGLNGSTVLTAARLYDPSLGVGCTSNAQCTKGFCVDGVCCDAACTGQCLACNLSGSVGVCSPEANGAACNDSNACTQTDTCQAATCVGGNPPNCDDNNPCTNDYCDMGVGCAHANVSCDARTGQIEAESFNSGQNVTLQTSSVSPNAAGASVTFTNVNFGAPGDSGRFTVSLLGSPGDRHVQLRLNSATGPLVADLFSLPSDAVSPAPQSTEFLTPVSGLHTVAIVFGSADAGALDWFKLEKGLGRDTIGDFAPGFQHQNPGQGLVVDNLPNIVGDGDDDAEFVTWFTANNGVAVQLAPGQRRGWEFSLPETLHVIAQARWIELSGNVSVSIINSQHQVIATAGPGTGPGGGFVATAISAPVPAQHVAVLFTNNGSSPIRVQLLAGARRVSP